MKTVYNGKVSIHEENTIITGMCVSDNNRASKHEWNPSKAGSISLRT